MANLRANKIVGIGSTDAGVTFDGPISLNTQGYMYFPTGDTTDRGRGRAVAGGGYQHPASPSYIKSIDYIEIQSMGNAVNFGDLITVGGWITALSSSTRGCFAGMGGPSPGGGAGDTIEYVTIATTGNATDFGNLTQARRAAASCSSSTRGIWFGGYTPTYVNTIDFATIATTGDATDFGDSIWSGAYRAVSYTHLRAHET